MLIGYALLLLSMLLYFVTLGMILPEHLLRPKYVAVSPDARGRRRCFVKGKRCVVYDRCLNQRRYLNRYLLLQGDGCKLLKCQVASNVRYMEYEVVLFDRYDQVLDVMLVKENFSTRYSKLLSLPNETSYVTLRLRQVNKTAFDIKPMLRVARKNVLLFIFGALILSVFESAMILVGSAYAFGGVFREDFARSPEHLLIGAAVSLLATLIGLVLVIVAIRRHMKA